MIRREKIEWLDLWVDSANASPALPRVLLIGDSITRSYYPIVEHILGDRLSCARLTTSKCITDPLFFKELDLVLSTYRFRVVHLNNGLHGLDYDDREYGAYLPRVFRVIENHAQDCRIIWAQTTPVRLTTDLTKLDPKTARVRERNRIARELAAARNVPVNDLFSLVADHPEYFAEDGVHLNNRGQTIVGERVAAFILGVFEGDSEFQS